MSYDIEINDQLYISVKGTAKAYDVKVQTIHYHIRQNPDIFENHIISQKGLKKIFKDLLSQKQQMAPDRKWLDKFAFYKIGTLLNSSPKTIPIKVICFLNKE